MNWFDGLIAFKKVAEQQSFMGAAREINTKNSVITKRIQWLEKQLGCNLFLRTTRKVTLTDAGAHLLKKINPLLEEWQDIYAQLLDYQKQPIGEITVCFPPNLGGVFSLAEAGHQFLKEYPGMRLHITNTHEPVDLLEKQIDILIAPQKYLLDPNTTIGVKLFDFNYQCFASPAYLKKYTTPQKPQDLAQHNCIVYRNDNQWEFAGKLYPVGGNFRADAADAMIQACVLGTGIIYMPRIFIQKEIKQGLIKSVLTNYLTKKDKMMIFYPRHAYKPRKIAVFIDFLRRYFK